MQQRRDLPAAPRDRGKVALICSRLTGDRRWLPDRALLDVSKGLQEDRWHRNLEPGMTKYGDMYLDMQLATMQLEFAELIANGQPLPLFGDNLFLNLDLSTANLPVGSELRIGETRLVVTPAPHDGCKKFRARFGADALRFVATKATRDENRRGIYLRVLEGGAIQRGDAVIVERRPIA